jgi:spore coat protein A, manganese oxidase
MLEQYERVRASAFSRPLPLPPVLVPRREKAADVYDVTVRAGLAQPLDGAPTPIVGFDGQWPGPTIHARQGRPVLLRVTNAHDRSVSIHNHGISCAPESDGHPLDLVKPGAIKVYSYPNQQSAGTYWFHDHAMGRSGENVYRGLAGLYLIHDEAEDTLGLPRGEHDIPLILQDRLFDEKNALAYEVDTGTIFKGHFGNTLCVNGVFTPYLRVATRRYRLRFLNGANSRSLRLALSDGRPLIHIATDGALLPAPVARPFVELAPAERCDCIVDFSGVPVGTSIVLRNIDDTWPSVPEALRFDVVKKERDPSKLPARLASVPRLEESAASVRRTVRFHIEDGKWTLNGLLYDPARIDFRPRLGATEIWTLENAESTQMHPFHQHLVPFQVLDIDGARPPEHLRGYKDTIAVGPGSTVRIIMKFTGFTGVYVFHCHKLEHEDHAMMLQQEIVA